MLVIAAYQWGFKHNMIDQKYVVVSVIVFLLLNSGL